MKDLHYLTTLIEEDRELFDAVMDKLREKYPHHEKLPKSTTLAPEVVEELKAKVGYTGTGVKTACKVLFTIYYHFRACLLSLDYFLVDEPTERMRQLEQKCAGLERDLIRLKQDHKKLKKWANIAVGTINRLTASVYDKDTSVFPDRFSSHSSSVSFATSDEVLEITPRVVTRFTSMDWAQ